MRGLRGVGAASAVLLKGAKIVSILKLAKFTKVLVTATSMLISLLAYGWAFGPLFAVAIISMLFIHEMGHVIAMWHKGMKTSGPVFIPFLGAAIFAPNVGDRATEAYIGYGGPLLGSIGAFVCMALWMITDSPLLLVTAFIGLYINLFNMIPIRPLDGGRIAQVLGRNTHYVGMMLLMAYTFILQEPSLLLIWILVLQEFSWPLWWRSAVAAVLSMLMPLGFWLWDSHQPWFIDYFDCAAAIGFTMLFVWVDQSRWRAIQHGLPDFAGDDGRPYPPGTTRLSWLAIYLVSLTVLWASMWYLIEHLPQLH